MNTRILAAAMVLLTACGTSQQDSAKPKSLKDMGSVDQLLAPIALYPDPLIAQILLSAQDPAKVTEFDKWLKANKSLKGSQLQDAAVKAGFEPSLVALTLFPTVVARMADQISWTTLVGQAFTSDRSAVFDAIQRLRKHAQDVGTLKTTAQQQVSAKKTSTGNDVIVIEPANPQVVYVPQYNPEVVYTQPPATAAAPATTTSNTTVMVVEEDDDDAAEMVAAGLSVRWAAELWVRWAAALCCVPSGRFSTRFCWRSVRCSWPVSRRSVTCSCRSRAKSPRSSMTSSR